jgi:hypothetical protein
MRKIILTSLLILGLTSGLAESSDKKHDWSNVKKLKRETWIQIKTTDGRKVEGQFGDLAGDKVLLIAGSNVLRFSKDEINEISKAKRGLAKSILIGAGVGYVGGLLAGVAIESQYGGEDKGLFTVMAAMAGSAIGASGAAIDGIDRWRLVYKKKEEHSQNALSK